MDKWEGILQQTVDTAREIHIRGVVMGECQPGNVIVQVERCIPIIHDFAQAKAWDPMDTGELIEVICQKNNPRNII